MIKRLLIALDPGDSIVIRRLTAVLLSLSIASYAQVIQTFASLAAQNVFTQTNTFPNIIDLGLTAGNCMQASTGGLLLTTSVPCSPTITLKYNNTNLSSQTTLNLIAGSNITLTDGGGGALTIAASGGGGGVTGSGTANTHAMWASTSVLENSHLSEVTTAFQPQFNFNGPYLNINTGASGNGYLECTACSGELLIETTPGGANILLQAGSPGCLQLDAPVGVPFEVCSNASGGAWVYFPGASFSGFPSPSAGAVVYCNNCNINTNPCTSGGAGDIAIFNGTSWRCP